MKRLLAVLAGQLGALVLVAWIPWLAVGLLAFVTAAGSWAVARPGEDRAVRRRLALAVGSLDGLLVAGAWLAFAGDPALAAHPPAVRGMLAAALFLGGALAGGALVLVGADARG